MRGGGGGGDGDGDGGAFVGVACGVQMGSAVAAPSLRLNGTKRALATHHAVVAVHRKNCEPFVLGPALAIESTPGPAWRSVKFSSGKRAP